MVNINLLPWRAHKHAYEQRKIRKILGISILFTSVFLLATHGFLAKKINDQQLRNELLSKKIALFSHSNQKIEKIEELTMANLRNIFNYQNNLIKLFDELKKARNFATCFTTIYHENNSIFFTANAKSIADMTLFLTHFPGHFLFSEINFVDMKIDKKNQSVHFRFSGIENNPLKMPQQTKNISHDEL